MNRTPVCRDFLRGSCRFGARCKFSHNASQQQRQQPTSPFGFGVKNQGQNQHKGGNYYNPLAYEKNQPQATTKEHRCTDRKECKLQIKEDLEHEQPVFWRLTCYSHGKFLPNDIGGDISFEELRAHAYATGKQGMSFESVVQNEKSMFAAKKREFDHLLNNPYLGPSSPESGGLLTSNQLQLADASKMAYGSVAPVVAPSPFKSPFGFAGPAQDHSQSKGLSAFGGVKQSGGFSFGVGASPAGSANTFNLPSSQSPPAPGFSFGVHASEPVQGSSPLQHPVQGLSPPQHAFPSSSLPFSGLEKSPFNFSPSMGNPSGSPLNPFGISTPFQAVSEAEMSDNLLSPFGQANGGAKDPSTQMVTHSTNHIMPVAPLSQQHEIPPGGKTDIWLKARWAIGEIPEEEPPTYAR